MLLRLMLGQLQASSGRTRVDTKLEVAYFDQYRAELDPDRTVMDSLTGSKQEVMVNGKPRHVLSCLQDFLFHPKRVMTPVRALSDRERNRPLLARLFLKPNNLLILDESANGPGVETLKLLEELIDGYQDTVMLVSHDRQPVNNAVTECWVFEGGGRTSQYIGGYRDARSQRAQSLAQKQTIARKATEIAQPKAETVKHSGNKLSYNLQHELGQLSQKLETLEAELQTLQEQVADPNFFGQSHDRTQRVLAQLAEAGQALGATFERWRYLEGLKSGV